MGVQVVDVVDVELVGDIRVALSCGCVLFRFGVGFGEDGGEFDGLALELVEVVEDGEAFGEDGAARRARPSLREVAEGDALVAGDGAVVEGLDAADDLEEGRFAGAVAPTRPVRSSGLMSQFASSKRSFWPKRLPAAESWSICFYFLIGL